MKLTGNELRVLGAAQSFRNYVQLGQVQVAFKPLLDYLKEKPYWIGYDEGWTNFCIYRLQHTYPNWKPTCSLSTENAPELYVRMWLGQAEAVLSGCSAEMSPTLYEDCAALQQAITGIEYGGPGIFHDKLHSDALISYLLWAKSRKDQIAISMATNALKERGVTL